MFKTYDARSDRLNDAKRFIRPFVLTPDAPNNNGMAINPAVGASITAPSSITQEGPFEGFHLIADSTTFRAVGDHQCTVMMRDMGSQKYLMNRVVHANTVFGTSQFPCLLKEFMFLEEERSISWTFQNLFPVANNIQPIISGRRFYQSSAGNAPLNAYITKRKLRYIKTTPFFLTTNLPLVIAAGQTVPFQMTVDPDGAFDGYAFSAVWYDTTLGAGFLNTGTFTWELRDSESRRSLMTGRMNEQLALGDGRLPFQLPESIYVMPNMRLELEVTNTHPNPLSNSFTILGKKFYLK